MLDLSNKTLLIIAVVIVILIVLFMYKDTLMSYLPVMGQKEGLSKAKAMKTMSVNNLWATAWPRIAI